MYKDRQDAAHKLAEQLQEYKNKDDVIILAIPRGSLEIGAILADELHAPLDVIFVKKIGAPGNREMAIGSVSMNRLSVAPEYQHLTEYIDAQVKDIRTTLKKRIKNYRGDMPKVDLKNKTVILIDDGVATGKTLMMAIDVIKDHDPKKIIVAIPVGPASTIEQIKKKVDTVICPLIPASFYAVGQFYTTFPQIEDEQAIKILKKAQRS